MDHIRNLDDNEIRAVAEKGGLVGIVAYGPVLAKGRRATLNDWCNNVDYVAKLVGVNHVCVGLDAYPATPEWWRAEFKRQFPEIGGSFPFDTNVEGLSSPTMWRNIIPGLLERGYSEGDILKVLGENAVGLLRRVWKA